MTPDFDADFFVIGVATRTRNADELSPSTARIPELWDRALAHPWLSERRVAGSGFVAVLTDYESDAAGSYTQIVGVPAAQLDRVPEGLVAISVPARRRVRVVAEGPMPAALIGAWRQIWADEESGAIARAYRTDVEIHADGSVQLLVSVVAG